MRRSLIPSIAIVTLLLAGTVAEAQSTRFAQRGSPDVTDDYHSALNVYYKTWSDLNQAQKQVVGNAGDWYRYEVARGQMDFLERTWEDGTFDRAQVNDAISDVEFVLKFNNLSSQDRNALARDLDQLRDIRMRYGR
jgi:hypothetical protein